MHAQTRRLSLAEANKSAIERLGNKGGFRDRKSGAFTLPEEDTMEPARTERLLATPFAWMRPRTGDAFQAIEGHFFFRVNGASRVGMLYRLIVILVNMTFGLLSGLQPLLPLNSISALAQTSLVLSLQLSMSALCFYFLPDADRIISRFAGTQFLFEGLSTASVRACLNDFRKHPLFASHACHPSPTQAIHKAAAPLAAISTNSSRLA